MPSHPFKEVFDTDKTADWNHSFCELTGSSKNAGSLNELMYYTYELLCEMFLYSCSWGTVDIWVIGPNGKFVVHLTYGHKDDCKLLHFFLSLFLSSHPSFVSSWQLLSLTFLPPHDLPPSLVLLEHSRYG